MLLFVFLSLSRKALSKSCFVLLWTKHPPSPTSNHILTHKSYCYFNQGVSEVREEIQKRWVREKNRQRATTSLVLARDCRKGRFLKNKSSFLDFKQRFFEAKGRLSTVPYRKQTYLGMPIKRKTNTPERFLVMGNSNCKERVFMQS